MVKLQRTRPVSEGKTSKTAGERYKLIKSAMDQYSKAMKNGYYIEAIALMESAICDRMESTLNYMCQDENFSYSTLGKLVDNARGKTYFSKDLLDSIQDWSKKRNDAIHEMVKLQPENNISFQEHYDTLKSCAEEGLALFNRLKKERSNHKIPNKVPVKYKLRDRKKSPKSYPEILKIVAKAGEIKKKQDDGSLIESIYYEADNGLLWKEQLIELYYDIVKEE